MGEALGGEDLAAVRVLMLSEPSYPRHPGGSGRASHTLAVALARRGHRVHLVSLVPGRGERREIEGVDVHWVQAPDTAGGPLDRAAEEGVLQQALRTYLEAELPLGDLDVVHDSCGFLSELFPLAAGLRRDLGVPWVVHFRYLLHRHQELGAPGGALSPFSASALALEDATPDTCQCFAVRGGDLVITPSQADALFVEELYRPRPWSLAVVPDPVDAEIADAAPVADLRLHPEERLLLFGGRPGSLLKGGDLLEDAFERLLRAEPRARLLLVGNEGEQTRALRQRLGSEVVRPLGWVADAARMASILKAVEVVLVPSRYESFGLLTAEALAVGTPVVASPVGAAPELLAEGAGGFLLPGRDTRSWPAALAELTLRLLSDPQQARALGEGGRRRVHRQLSLETVGRRLEGLYGRLQARAPTACCRAHLESPVFRPADSQRLLHLLRELSNAEGATAALAPELFGSAERRCPGCTYRRIAAEIRRLAGQREPWAPGASPLPACPLSLLQKDSLRDRQRRLPGDLAG